MNSSLVNALMSNGCTYLANGVHACQTPYAEGFADMNCSKKFESNPKGAQVARGSVARIVQTRIKGKTTFCAANLQAGTRMKLSKANTHAVLLGPYTRACFSKDRDGKCKTDAVVMKNKGAKPIVANEQVVMKKMVLNNVSTLAPAPVPVPKTVPVLKSPVAPPSQNLVAIKTQFDQLGIVNNGVNGFVASASSTAAGSQAWYAFDLKADTEWQSGVEFTGNVANGSTVTKLEDGRDYQGAWLQLDMPFDMFVSQVGLQVTNTWASPLTFAILGKTRTNPVWKVLYETGDDRQMYRSPGEARYPLKAPQSLSSIRLCINRVITGPRTETRISGMRLIA